MNLMENATQLQRNKMIEYFTKKMTPFHSFDDVIKQVTLFDF